jgi:hypothetical protein
VYLLHGAGLRKPYASYGHPSLNNGDVSPCIGFIAPPPGIITHTLCYSQADRALAKTDTLTTLVTVSTVMVVIGNQGADYGRRL